MNEKIFILSMIVTCFLILQNVSATPTNIITSCTTIDKSGDYYLTEDILDSNAYICIKITANNVSLYCDGHIIDGIDKSTATYGIYSYNNNTLIHNCTISDWKQGIKYFNANSGHVLNNKIYSNIKNGIILVGSSHNKIAYNEIYDNDVGLRFEASSNNNEINDNRIMNNNKGISITVGCTNPNIIYNNYISGNGINVEDKGSTFWNTPILPGPNIIGGLNISGNYFSDYEGIDADGNGFGDTPYNILGGSNQDINPLAIPEVPTIFLSIGMMFLSLIKMKRKIN